MNNITHDINNGQKVGRESQLFSYGTGSDKPVCPNGKIKRIAEPHIEHKKKDGKLYYWYRRGTDPKIYLGTADNILHAVQQTKIATSKKVDSLFTD